MKIKSTGVAVLGTAALLAAASATAGEVPAGSLPWTYLEVGYAKQDGNDLLETDGFQVKGSIGFLNQWHAQVEYTDGDMDSDMELDADFDGYRLVVGAHPQLTEKTQLVADLQYFDYDLEEDNSSWDASTDGYGIGLGLRHSLSDKFELMAQVWYVDAEVDYPGSDDFDYNDTLVELGGRYNWTPNFSTGVTVGLNGSLGGATAAWDDYSGDVYRLDLRWSFGAGDVSDSF
jgi:hypothetical protein